MEVSTEPIALERIPTRLKTGMTTNISMAKTLLLKIEFKDTIKIFDIIVN